MASTIRRPARWAVVFAFLLPAVASGAIAQTWITSGTVIAAGDLAPPVQSGSGYVSHWNHVSSGTGGPSYQIGKLPMWGGISATRALGIDATGFQRIWYALLLAAAAMGLTYFALGLVGPLAAGAAGVLAVVNPLSLVVGPNPIPWATIGVGGLLGGALLRAASDRPSRRGEMMAFGLGVGALGVIFMNPPHVAIVLIWIMATLTVIIAVRGGHGVRRIGAFLMKAVPIGLALSLWWVVPAYLTINSPNFAATFTADDPSTWTWTHQRGSLKNALALNTAWGWERPEYVPYATSLDHSVIGRLRFAPALVGLSALMLTRGRRRRAAAVLSVAALAAMWIGKGVQPPLGEANLWLYEHAPGFWLFRTPTKVLLIASMALAVLGGMTLHALWHRRSFVARGSACLIFGALFIYPHPIATGAVIPDERPLLPSSHVRVPQEWSAMANTLNAQPPDGKLLVLPAADFYQLPTRWGYYGVPFTSQIVHRPVLEPAPGGFFESGDSMPAIIAEIQARVAQGDDPAVTLRLLRALGARYILVRGDLDTTHPGREIADPERIRRRLLQTPGISLLRRFDSLSLFRVVAPQPVDAYAAAPIPTAASGDQVAALLAGLPSSAALYEMEPSARAPREEGTSIVQSPGGAVTAWQTDLEPLWLARARLRGGKLSVTLRDPLSTSISGHALPKRPSIRFSFPAVQPPAFITVGSRTFLLPGSFRGTKTLGFVRAGGEVEARVRVATERPIDLRAPGPVGDCHARDSRTAAEVGLARSISRQDGSVTLTLQADDHSACVAYDLPPAGPLFLQLEYRNVEGLQPRICLFSAKTRSCDGRSLALTDRWTTFDVLSPSRVDRLYFYADSDGTGRTVNQYRRVTVLMPAGNPHIQTRLVPTPYAKATITVPGGTLPYLVKGPVPDPDPIDLSAPPQVSDCHRYDERSLEEVGIAASVDASTGVPALQLRARDHAACVAFPITPVEPGSPYRVEMEYRWIAGRAPRFCVWDTRDRRCVAEERLSTSPQWTMFDAAIDPAPESDMLSLFLYADGQRQGTDATVVEYRDVSVRADPPMDLALLPDSPAAGMPAVGVTRRGPTEFEVHVRDARTPYLLVLNETFAPGWKIEDPGSERSLTHVRANGFANGWLVRMTGTYTLTLTYAPEKLAHAARLASLVALAMLGALIVVALIRKGRLRDIARRPEPRTEDEQRELEEAVTHTGHRARWALLVRAMGALVVTAASASLIGPLPAALVLATLSFWILQIDARLVVGTSLTFLVALAIMDQAGESLDRFADVTYGLLAAGAVLMILRRDLVPSRTERSHQPHTTRGMPLRRSHKPKTPTGNGEEDA